MTQPTSDLDEEPTMACENCAYWELPVQECINKHSVWQHQNTTAWMGCAQFFPDPKRWPDADHG